MRQALLAGVSGIVAGSIAIRDFEGFLRTDLLSLLDEKDVEQAQATLPAMTVLFTEGLGTTLWRSPCCARCNNIKGRLSYCWALPLHGKVSCLNSFFRSPPEEIQRYWHPINKTFRSHLGHWYCVEWRIRGGRGNIVYFFI